MFCTSSAKNNLAAESEITGKENAFMKRVSILLLCLLLALSGLTACGRDKNKPETDKKGYVCRICGWVYEGEELPEDIVCPLCKHGAADFEPIA